MRCSPAWGRRRGGRCPGETLRRWDMPEESGRRVLELCLGREIELMIFAGEEIVVDPFSKESLSRTTPSPSSTPPPWWRRTRGPIWRRGGCR